LPGGAVQADADELGSAIMEGIALWDVMHGNALIAAGGAVTVVAGTGHDFTTAINKVCGDSTS
jgi:hypothetical protein